MRGVFSPDQRTIRRRQTPSWQRMTFYRHKLITSIVALSLLLLTAAAAHRAYVDAKLASAVRTGYEDGIRDALAAGASPDTTGRADNFSPTTFELMLDK